MSESAAATEPTVLVFPPEHPAFLGHFPQRPIVPGALLLDAALHAIEAAHPPASGASGYHVAAVKFFRPVGPGEVLTLTLARSPEGQIQFAWCIGIDRIASGTVVGRTGLVSGHP
jgi:3-hydroxymyristoyl/3-hydroxydecanoyl-(acyl carrier protein) dehydratase